MTTIDKAILKARRTWNAAAHKSRELSSLDAAAELLTAASIVTGLLEGYVDSGPSDDDVEAGY